MQRLRFRSHHCLLAAVGPLIEASASYLTLNINALLVDGAVARWLMLCSLSKKVLGLIPTSIDIVIY